MSRSLPAHRPSTGATPTNRLAPSQLHGKDLPSLSPLRHTARMADGVDDGPQVRPTVLSVPPDDETLMRSVINLGDRHRDRLGFLPHPVFTEMAQEGNVIAAVIDGETAGYTCFDLTRRYVRPVHLCVDQKHRERGHRTAATQRDQKAPRTIPRNPRAMPQQLPTRTVVEPARLPAAHRGQGP